MAISLAPPIFRQPGRCEQCWTPVDEDGNCMACIALGKFFAEVEANSQFWTVDERQAFVARAQELRDELEADPSGSEE